MVLTYRGWKGAGHVNGDDARDTWRREERRREEGTREFADVAGSAGQSRVRASGVRCEKSSFVVESKEVEQRGDVAMKEDAV